MSLSVFYVKTLTIFKRYFLIVKNKKIYALKWHFKFFILLLFFVCYCIHLLSFQTLFFICFFCLIAFISQICPIIKTISKFVEIWFASFYFTCILQFCSIINWFRCWWIIESDFYSICYVFNIITFCLKNTQL